MKRSSDRHRDLVDLGLKAGASKARVISAAHIVIDPRVRLKCEVPRCASFGRSLTCPPHVMPVETFSGILAAFEYGLLVQVEAVNVDSTKKASRRIDRVILKQNSKVHYVFKRKLLEIVEAVESAAFKKGLRFATGLTGGSCILCPRCVADEHSQACRHPFRARPAMEALGIDVIKTAENAGTPIRLSSSENVLWTGLILLE